jgi:hypothetical protein
MVRRIACVALLLGTAFAQGTPDASAQFQQLLGQLKNARQAKNEPDLLSASLALAKLLHDSGPSTEQVAMVYAQMGDREHALQYLREFVAMGQSDDKLASRPQFKSVQSLPQFKEILAEMHANETPIERASRVAEFRDANLLPEDIDYDPNSKSFYVTSVLEKKIVRVDAHGAQTDFAKAPDAWPMLAIKVDSRRGVVWATEVAMDGFVQAPSKDWGRSAVVCFRLSDGKLVRKIDAPHTALGDMALMPNGDPIVSDGGNGGVYQVRANELADKPALDRVDGGQFISPQTPAPEPDGQHVFVPDYTGGVGLLDLKTKQVQWVNASHQYALNGIDGLYLWNSDLIATQNGTSPERVALFHVDAGLRVTSESIFERSTPTLGDPTHGVVVRNVFYYIANSGWDALDDNGRVKRGSNMTPAVIMAAPLRH